MIEYTRKNKILTNATKTPSRKGSQSIDYQPFEIGDSLVFLPLRQNNTFRNGLMC